MSLEQTLHSDWASNAALNALVSAERLFTGVSIGELRLPYVVLRRAGSQIVNRTADGRAIQRVRLDFHVWTATLENGREIAAAIGQRFDRRDFVLDDGAVRNMHPVGVQENALADGRWQSVLQYVVLIETLSG